MSQAWLYDNPSFEVGAPSLKPWLSVILPVYRGEEWLDRTLSSVAVGACPGIEVVVIDSSPDPESMAIIRRYEEQLELRIIEPGGIDGCSPKMNLGVEMASAEHISWLCQDDLWFPNRAGTVRNWIMENPRAVLHLAPSAIVDRNDRRLGNWRCPLKEDSRPLDSVELIEKLLVQNFVAVPSPIVRRDAWLACGGLDTTLWYTGDWDLWLKLARSGEVVYHGEVTAGFRVHGSSATSTGSRRLEDFAEQQRHVVNKHIEATPIERRPRLRQLADASISINAALAAGANGESGAIFDAVRTLAAMGPINAARYLHRSRLTERVLPRLRAKLAGIL
jgi:GT2 family glycosyltransferase